MCSDFCPQLSIAFVAICRESDSIAKPLLIRVAIILRGDVHHISFTVILGTVRLESHKRDGDPDSIEKRNPFDTEIREVTKLWKL